MRARVPSGTRRFESDPRRPSHTSEPFSNCCGKHWTFLIAFIENCCRNYAISCASVSFAISWSWWSLADRQFKYGNVALRKLGKKSIERSVLPVALSLVFLTLLMMQLLLVTLKEIAQSPVVIFATVFFVILLIPEAFALRIA